MHDDVELHDDDLPVGQILNRRDIFKLFGKAGAAALIGYGFLRHSNARAQTDSSCVVKTQVTEGPYWVDEKLNRTDVRTDPTTGVAKAGVPLQLNFNVARVNGTSCTPLVGALVDIWHCDALGVYSDVQAQSTVGQKFLRGYQATDSDGQARFTTIFPGWYRGRAVHIHFRIRTAGSGYASSNFVSQVFFDDTLTDTILSKSPYSSKGTRDTRNSNDMIYQQGGTGLLLPLTASGDGYTGNFNLGVAVACSDLAKGDVNADGSVTSADATYALRSSIGLEKPSDCILTTGDMNGDGVLNVQDTILILQKAIGL